ncbi:uncharacterized protein MYCGRDRAFT_107401 [Zymoseptoria tritici IPO323]|uniref:BHLH domain-containing protein n=1 Tax=Zymoseptoria tritici (strain CBS 115943 / IPO323) TaxID=336722 RepID=F9X154_ZYMTI|nr:uncharacterized protein MYCGRDRAFT_107401 [Zymoseptoria tritici IPO323]EGP92183.1 hypothetical protein MYCGRDRAFT_107401 [Zymoseptoria tritici IPO323]
MDTSAGQSWARAGEQQIDTMTDIPTDLDDLGNLFEFGDIDLNNISSMDATQFDHQLSGTHPSTPYDELSELQAMSATAAHDFGAQGRFSLGQNVGHGQTQTHFNHQVQTSAPFTSEPLYQPSMQQQFNSLQQQLQFAGMPSYPSSQHVPPTPNSFEMHGEAEIQSTFTPMVSPAGTPHYNVQPEFTIPGAYFSPLTSPMLHAQNHQHASQQLQQGFYTNPNTAPNSTVSSPLDPTADVDMLGEQVASSETLNANGRKPPRRKVATPRSVGPLARVKQSPIQKATKRRSTTVLSLATPKEVDQTLEGRTATQTTNRMHVRPNDSSENGSISPEPLSEALMGPPPRPGSASTKSPSISALRQQGTPAATPKSLLSRRSSSQDAVGQNLKRTQSIDMDADMEFADIQLPSAAADEPGQGAKIDRLNTSTATLTSIGGTPRLSARKTPKLAGISTPMSAVPASAAPSPIAASPMTASTPGALLKGRADSKSGRSSKKRASVSGTAAALASPALLPRISPNIKPLLPEGASLHSPTHALLLASKSNYQNLLEGNHLPVSKDGPQNSNSDGSPEDGAHDESKESKEDAALKSNSSKAATVESANEYIRKLQRENAALLQLKQENEEMRRKLEAQSSGSSAGGSVSAVEE